jgi:uncharacterized protein YbjT (DUF2867 family)
LVVLLTGATGFIGRHLAHALAAAGHEVVCASRDPKAASSQSSGFRYVEADFTRDFDPADWRPRLADVDVVVNAVGIIREHGRQTFESIHVRAPRALFTACAGARIRVIQISALGADDGAKSRYHKSKREADEILLRLCDSAVVAQPSLVYGPDGASARFLTSLASLPLVPVPDRGEQLLQPIHVDDLTAAIAALIENDFYRKDRIALVGPQPILLRDFLTALRMAMGLGRRVFIPVSSVFVNLTARAAEAFPGSLLDTETLQMLRRGNTADASKTRQLLGRAPRPVTNFIMPSEAAAVRTQAQLGWLLPMLRFAVAFVWIFTGIVSLGLYPVEQSYALLARVGITDWAASLALYGAALLNLAFGFAILFCKRRRLLWLAQAMVIVLYTVIITVELPAFWLHPYGPVLKNLPLLAAIWMLYVLERE